MPDKSLDQIMADYARLEAENLSLKAELANAKGKPSAAHPATKPEPQAVTPPAAAQATAPAKPTETKAKTATEMLLEAKGCKTVGELSAKQASARRRSTGLA